MKVIIDPINLKKSIHSYSDSGYEWYIPSTYFKFPIKNLIVESVAKVRGLSIDYIKSNFSHHIDKKYQSDLNRYLTQFIIEDVSLYVSDIINKGSIQTHFRRNVTDYLENTKTFVCKLNYEHSVKTAMYQDAKWVLNYKSGISSDTKDPFVFGDKTKVDFVETLLSNAGKIELNFIESDSNNTHTFYVTYEKCGGDIIYSDKYDNIGLSNKKVESGPIHHNKLSELNKTIDVVNEMITHMWRCVGKRRLLGGDIAGGIRYHISKCKDIIYELENAKGLQIQQNSHKLDMLYSVTYLVEGDYDKFYNSLKHNNVNIQYSVSFGNLLLRYGMTEFAIKHYEISNGVGKRFLDSLKNNKKVKLPPLSKTPIHNTLVDKCFYYN